MNKVSILRRKREKKHTWARDTRLEPQLLQLAAAAAGADRAVAVAAAGTGAGAVARRCGSWYGAD
jgi:hypothetical protein